MPMRKTATFTSFETTGGARIARIPLEVFPNFWAYVYVVQIDEYCALIDTGSGTDTSHENLLSGLQQAGIGPSDLTHIILTHAHIDHYGGLTKLRPLTNAEIGCHELDLQTVAHHEARLAWIGKRLASFLAETGLAAETREQILSIYRFAKAIYQSVPVDFGYESTNMRLGPLAFLHLPGHCPGHIAIRLDELVFCGDMVVEGVTPHLSPESIEPYSGLDHYLESLARLQHWAKDTSLVLNGHDEAITDLPAQIVSTKQNILRRMSSAVAALREPLTIDETCRAVYGETAGYNQLLTIEKTGAYLEYLYQRGMIEITNPEDLEESRPARYQRLKAEMTTITALETTLYRSTRVEVDR
jgi:glyoxylase-like metal-dependent hydrolase (beta-lactamase superfamily II)